MSEPDEERLWLVIAVLFGISILLLFASLSQPWFTASFYSGSGEIHGAYWFEEWEYRLCSNGDCQDAQKADYDRAPSWESLMFWARLFVGIGVVGIVGFGILLGLYYFGHLEQVGWLKVAWSVGFVATLVGITYFSLNAGSAGANQLVELVERRGFTGFGVPESRFWGSQSYAGGTLENAPGVGWLLAILALLNLVPPTILLYQFPEREEEVLEDDYVLEEGETGPRDGARSSEA